MTASGLPARTQALRLRLLRLRPLVSTTTNELHQQVESTRSTSQSLLYSSRSIRSMCSASGAFAGRHQKEKGPSNPGRRTLWWTGFSSENRSLQGRERRGRERERREREGGRVTGGGETRGTTLDEDLKRRRNGPARHCTQSSKCQYLECNIWSSTFGVKYLECSIPNIARSLD